MWLLYHQKQHKAEILKHHSDWLFAFKRSSWDTTGWAVPLSTVGTRQSMPLMHYVWSRVPETGSFTMPWLCESDGAATTSSARFVRCKSLVGFGMDRRLTEPGRPCAQTPHTGHKNARWRSARPLNFQTHFAARGQHTHEIFWCYCCCCCFFLLHFFFSFGRENNRNVSRFIRDSANEKKNYTGRRSDREKIERGGGGREVGEAKKSKGWNQKGWQ